MALRDMQAPDLWPPDAFQTEWADLTSGTHRLRIVWDASIGEFTVAITRQNRDGTWSTVFFALEQWQARQVYELLDRHLDEGE